MAKQNYNDYQYFSPTNGQNPQYPQPQPFVPPQGGNPVVNFLKKKWWLVLLFVVAMILCSILIVLTLGNLNKKEITNVIVPQKIYNNVSVKINSPQSLPQGTPGDWEILIENKETVAINNIKVKLKFDTFFVFVKEYNPSPDNPQGSEYSITKLDSINGRAPSATIRFQGYLNGNIDVETRMEGTISYTPETKDAAKSVELPIAPSITRISSPEIKINIEPTQAEVQNGGQAQLTVVIENITDREIRDLQLRLIYPENNSSFTYLASEYYRTTDSAAITQPDDGDDIWNITRLAARSKQLLKVVGRVNGNPETRLTFGSELGIKNRDNTYQIIWRGYKDIKITAQPLIITTNIVGKENGQLFTPGEQLTVEVNYQNNSQKTLNNVEIQSFIQDPANLLDLSTLSFTGGERGEISGSDLVWRAPKIPNLATLSPTQKGKFSYTVKTKDQSKFYNSNLDQQKYILATGAKIKAADTAEISTISSSYKAKGGLNFIALKPEKIKTDTATKKETYKITWQLTNLYSEVTNITIKSTAPGVGVWNQDSVKPESASSAISYNDRNGEILWNVGGLQSYTGSVREPMQISFELEINSSDRELLSESVATGIDVFTGEKYEKKLGNSNK
jgi:hypothetical protein